MNQQTEVKPTATDFCQSLEWGTNSIEWFGKSGLVPMRGNRVAKITLVYRGSVGDYTGFDVKIHDKEKGELDRQFFRFDDYLSQDSRIDGRTDYPSSGNRCFQVISHCGWHWYIAVPRSTRPFCEAVLRYIDLMDAD